MIEASTSNQRDALSGSVMARDGAAIALTALGLGIVVSKGLSSIIAGAAPLIFLIGMLIVGWPTAIVARVRGHHGLLRAACLGAGLAAPLALFALVSGSIGEAGFFLGLGAVGAVLTWLSVRAQALPTLLLPEQYRARGRYLIAGLVAVGVLVVLVRGLVPQGDPESSRTVAAIEVPLRTSVDRVDLLAMLHRHAREEGLHVDDGSQEWIEFRRNAPADEPPSVRDVLAKTIHVSVWRGADGRDLEVLVDDGGHQGRPWLMFLRGDQPELATKARLRLLAEIKARWPEARDIPVLPSGSLPLADNLHWTGTAYVVKPEHAASYAR